MAEREAKLEQASARVELIARRLAVAYGPEKAAGVLAGALVSLCMAAGGRVAAIEFLEDVTTQLCEDHPENWAPDLGGPSTC